MNKCLDDSTFLFAHEKIDIGDSHPRFHEGTKGLVDMCVYEIEGAVFKKEIEDCVNYMGRWTVCG